MRKYLTTFFWYEDRLSSLSWGWLLSLTFVSLALLGAIAFGLRQFLDDLGFLLAESDLGIAAIFFGLLVLASASMWVLSCCLGALGRRLMLWRGL